MLKTIPLCCLMLVTAFSSVSAETVYVTDKLRLGLYEQNNGGGKQLKLLTSGDRLELIERTKYFAQVETDDGLIGWTKLGFLVDEVPPSYRTAELEVQAETVTRKLESAEQNLLLSQQQTAESEQQLAVFQNESVQSRQTIGELQKRQNSLQTELAKHTNSVPLEWLLFAAGAALAIGFLAGLWCLDFIIRKRHGGFRVY